MLKLAVGLCLAAGVLVNFANVIARYVFEAPFIWADETLVFLMIWAVFLGAAIVTWEGQHLRVDLLTRVAPRWLKMGLGVIETFVFAAVCVFMIMQSWLVVGRYFANTQVSMAARVPMEIPHAALLVGFTCMLILALLRLPQAFVNGDAISGAPEAELEVSNR
ncbi:MAG: TRAP transporter small permease [Pseudomonadota bacterium]